MRKYLFFAVFSSGMCSLAIEMAASRLLGNTFGTSNLVWASIIGLILLYLAAGYALGGPWADRSPRYETFFGILVGAGLATAIVPMLSRPVLRLAGNAFDELQLGILFGSFMTVIILLSVPVTLLGTASPFAIRLAANTTADLGRTSGRVYAISTLGSFLGTFLPGLVLIPAFGTYRTFLIIAGLLVVTGALGLFLIKRTIWAVAAVLGFVILVVVNLVFGLRGTDKSSLGLIYETESAYNYIQVLEQDGYRLLRLNEGQGVHSIYHPTQMNYYGPWEQMLAAPFFNQAPFSPANVKRMAIVGLAAGTTARQAELVFPGIQIDGYEIDQKIVDVGERYFDMQADGLTVHVADGRWGLEHSPYQYDIISLDAYRPPYIPSHLTTVEFFQIVHAKLTPDGAIGINIGRSPEDRRLIDALATTVRQVFPTVCVVDVPQTFNSVLFATKQANSCTNLNDNLTNLKQDPGTSSLLLETMTTAAANLQPDPPNSIVFTDDKAPIEWITNTMVLSFLLNPESELPN